MIIFNNKDNNFFLTKHPVIWASDWHKMPTAIFLFILLNLLFYISFTNIASLDKICYFIDKFQVFLGIVVIIFIVYFFTYKMSKKFSIKGTFNVITQYTAILIPQFIFILILFGLLICCIYKISSSVNSYDLEYYSKYSYRINNLDEASTIWNSDTLARLKKVFPSIRLDTTFENEGYYDENKGEFINIYKKYYNLNNADGSYLNNYVIKIKDDPFFMFSNDNALNLSESNSFYVYILFPFIFFISNLIYMLYYQNRYNVMSTLLRALIFQFLSIIYFFNFASKYDNSILILFTISFFCYFLFILGNRRQSYFLNEIAISFFAFHPFWIYPIFSFLFNKSIFNEYLTSVVICFFISVFGALKISKYSFMPRPYG